jgi:hypothetical protein
LALASGSGVMEGVKSMLAAVELWTVEAVRGGVCA